MTTDKIIAAAREAGWSEAQLNLASPADHVRLQRFYAIAYRAGMERAAEICERVWPSEDRSGHEWSDGFADGTCDCADAIRAEAHAKNQTESTHDTGNV